MLVVLGLVITLFFAVLALFADQIAPYDEDQYRKEVGVEADGTPDLRDAPEAGLAPGRTTRSAPPRAASTCSRG